MQRCDQIPIHPQDTITGFLLAGCGNIDLRKKTNFLAVDSSKYRIAGGGGKIDVDRAFSTPTETSVKQIETAFKEFTSRDDVAIVLISQTVANMIRMTVDGHVKVCMAAWLF
jgi:V-type H+-transporting ATPase subunit F